MRFLTLSDLGLLTLVITIMGLFSIFQIGFLNGGFRIFSVDNPNKWVTNNTIYSYFSIIGIICIGGISCALALNRISMKDALFAIPAILFGLLLVFNNWNRNILTAQQRFKEINRIEIASTVFSFTLLFTVYYFKIYGALLVVFSKELVFYSLTMLRNKAFLPQHFSLKLKDVRWILKFGFLPFLAGVVVTLNLQIETWSIAAFLSTEALGEFYLPKLYIQLFLILPLAVSQLFFPETMRAFTKGDFLKVKKTLKRYFFVNLGYSILAITLTWFFMDFVINFAIPKHVPGIHYVWIVIPGLVVYTLHQPIGLIFNGSVKLKPFLWASGAALLVTMIVLPAFGLLDRLSLEIVAIIKCLSYFTSSFVLLAIYLMRRQSLWVVNKQAEELTK